MYLLSWGKREGEMEIFHSGRICYKEFATGIRSDHGDGFILGVGVGLSVTGSGGVN